MKPSDPATVRAIEAELMLAVYDARRLARLWLLGLEPRPIASSYATRRFECSVADYTPVMASRSPDDHDPVLDADTSVPKCEVCGRRLRMGRLVGNQIVPFGPDRQGNEWRHETRPEWEWPESKTPY